MAKDVNRANASAVHVRPVKEGAMRGRTPSGPEYVASLPGSEQAKQRLQVILETMTHAYGVQEACRRLDISEQRFYQLRTELLQAAIDCLEPKPTGRPSHNDVSKDADVTTLQARVAELETELRAAQLRQEIAAAMPHVVYPPPEPEKKTPPREKRQARPGWWRKKK